MTVGDREDRSSEQLIMLWETGTGRERGSFIGHIGRVNSVAISAGGRFGVTGSDGTAALVWDATKPPHATVRRPSEKPDLLACFKDLAGDNFDQAYASIWPCINSPKEAVKFLADQRSLFAQADVEQIRRRIRDLESNKFAERDRTSRKLASISSRSSQPLTPNPGWRGRPARLRRGWKR